MDDENNANKADATFNPSAAVAGTNLTGPARDFMDDILSFLSLFTLLPELLGQTSAGYSSARNNCHGGNVRSVRVKKFTEWGAMFRGGSDSDKPVWTRTRGIIEIMWEQQYFTVKIATNYGILLAYQTDIRSRFRGPMHFAMISRLDNVH